ncbi:MAG: hypothetical protein E7409_04910 [Ruminococcaceae bacterium]|nr:hypothetical protein [Oscillospiraceae bacterium]
MYRPVSPNLPHAPICAALVDYRLPESICEGLQRQGITLVRTFAHPDLPEGLNGHPDLQICHVQENHAVCAPGLEEYYWEKLLPYGISVMPGKQMLGGTYPQDAAYNVARMGECMVCAKTREASLSAFAKTVILVRQGYVKCNLCVVNETSVITSDAGIAKALTGYGMDVLCIRSGYIALKGYSYGFIGGATGLIAPDCLAFFGRADFHPDYSKIKAFCLQRGVTPVLLGDEPLADYGSLLPLATLA